MAAPCRGQDEVEGTDSMADTGPVFLRRRPGSGPAPVLERFGTLDAALDAVEARWQTLQHQVPQILDARRVLLLSTEDLHRMMEAEAP
jgi:hypothetical protein